MFVTFMSISIFILGLGIFWLGFVTSDMLQKRMQCQGFLVLDKDPPTNNPGFELSERSVLGGFKPFENMQIGSVIVIEQTIKTATASSLEAQIHLCKFQTINSYGLDILLQQLT